MERNFFIIFRGALREGFQQDQVRSLVATYLKADPRQIDRMFSGKPVILRKNLSERGGLDYISKLQRIGLDAVLGKKPEKASPPPEQKLAATSASLLAPTDLPAAYTATPFPTLGDTPAAQPSKPDGWVSESGFADFERTHLNLSRAEALLNGTSIEAPPAPKAPALVVAPDTVAAQSPETLPEPVQPEPEALQSPLALTNKPGLTMSATFLCNHCGTLHHLDAQIPPTSQPEVVN